CRALAPKHAFLNKPVVDTLYLSPLAFPENPYHRLVKNYKLVRDGLSDPLADAKLAEMLFRDQWEALREQQQAFGIASFYHYALSGNHDFAGLCAVFEAIGADAPGASQAFDIF